MGARQFPFDALEAWTYAGMATWQMRRRKVAYDNGSRGVGVETDTTGYRRGKWAVGKTASGPRVRP